MHCLARLTHRRPRPSISGILTTITVVTVLAAAAPAQVQFALLPGNSWPVTNLRDHAVELADLDGDGDLDAVFAKESSIPYQILINDGYGGFTDETLPRLPGPLPFTLYMNDVAVGDVDGDGDMDLAFATDGLDRLYLNDGQGNFTDVTSLQMPQSGGYTESLAFGDIDGDGDLDLAASTPHFCYFGCSPSNNVVYINDGSGSFTGQAQFGNSSTFQIALTDVDGDGDLDALLANIGWSGGSGRNELWLNDGSGMFSNATVTNMPTNADDSFGFVTGDIDGDGDIDAVSRFIYVNDGSGVFTQGSPAQFRRPALGDVDGDGDLDLVDTEDWPGTGRNRLWLNDGSGQFTEVSQARMPVSNTSPPWDIALGDIDGDGDLDAVFANVNPAHSLSELLFNVQRQIDAPTPAAQGQPYSIDAYLRYGPASAGDLALIYLSTAPASIPLPPFGTLGLNASQAVGLPLVAIPQPAGVGTASVQMPSNPALNGQAIYLQAMLVAFPNTMQLSNVVRETL